jgi:two-component system invasion response regulator UvrY
MATGAVINILIVDDHPALREGLRSVLSSVPGFLIQGDVTSGELAYAWYRSNRPDVVTMDLSMAGFGGIEAIHRIVAFDPEARVLVYTVHTSEVLLHRALGAGALGYVTKGSMVEDLIEGIREVAQHRTYVSRDMVPALIKKHGDDSLPLLEQLTQREFQIFHLLIQGHSVADCAQILNLSGKTVSNHYTHIKLKLGLSNPSDMTRLAIRAGLLDP